MKSTAVSPIFMALALSSCSPISPETEQAKPDLVIRDVSWAFASGYGWAGLLDCEITIENIGKGPFRCLLYVSATSAKQFQVTGRFGGSTLVYANLNSSPIEPKPISAGEVIHVRKFAEIPTDTSIVLFYINTNDWDFRPGDVPLPTCAESDYGNNFYELILHFP